MDNIKKWQELDFTNGLQISQMLLTQSAKEIRIVMPKNECMKEHKAPFPIMVQVLKGRIDFGISDKTYILNELDSINLDANIPHSLYGLEDSIIRLSLSLKDDTSRVENVAKL